MIGCKLAVNTINHVLADERFGPEFCVWQLRKLHRASFHRRNTLLRALLGWATVSGYERTPELLARLSVNVVAP